MIEGNPGARSLLGRRLVILEAALRQEAHVLTRLPDELSPDLHNTIIMTHGVNDATGRLLTAAASACTNRTWLRLRRQPVLGVADRTLVSILDPPGSPVFGIAWSPSEPLVATGGEDTIVRIWNSRTGALESTMEGHSDKVSSLAWSPRGDALASGSLDGSVRIWDVVGRAERLVLSGNGPVDNVAWAPDGRVVASAGHDGVVLLCSSVDGSVLDALRGHESGVNGLTWSPDGATLASSDDSGVILLRKPGRESRERSLLGHRGAVGSLAWSPAGDMLASAGMDRSLRLWKPDTNLPPAIVEGLGHPPTLLAWSPDGSTLAWDGVNNTVSLWELAKGPQGASTLVTGHHWPVWAMSWSPDGSVLATGAIDGTRVLRPTGEPPDVLQLRSIACCALSPDGRLLATGDSAHDSEELAVGFATGGGSSPPVLRPCAVHVWSRNATKPDVTLEGHRDHISWVAWSGDGHRLASASTDGVVRLWNLDDGIAIAELRHDDWVTRVGFSVDGRRVATGTIEGDVLVWDTASSNLIAVLGRHDIGRPTPASPSPSRRVTSLGWSPDGAALASGGRDGTVRLWNPAGRQAPMVIAAHDDGVYALAWSPAGDSIASGSRDCSAKVWTSAAGRLLVALVGHEGEVDVVDWSADGTRLATASGDTTVRLWDVADGVCLAIARCLSQVIPSLVYGGDGSELHVADDGGATAHHPVRYTFEISTGA